MRPSVKITLKPPIIFSTLTNLIERGMNHEFIVNSFTTTVSLDTLTDCPVNRVPLLSLPTTKEDHHEESIVKQITQEIVNRVELDLAFQPEVVECLEDVLEKVVSQHKVPRPTTLSFTSCTTYEQSKRHKSEILALPSDSTSLYLNRRSAVEINTSSLSDWPAGAPRRAGGMVASTLVSPDTPRAQRKYQQVYLNGAAYTNLCLKVTTPPTFCCTYSPFPMTVQQEAVPQLSFYSEWRAQPVPAGDILEIVGGARALLAAYDSREAVAQQHANKHAQHFRLVSLEGGAHEGGGGGLTKPSSIQTDANKHAIESGETDKEEEEEEEEEAKSTSNFLDRITTRLHNLGLIDKTSFGRSKPSTTSEANKLVERCTALEHIRKTIIVPGGGDCAVRTRVIDTSVGAKNILTHSNYHQRPTLTAPRQAKRLRADLPARSMVIAANGRPGLESVNDHAHRRNSTCSLPSITTSNLYNDQNPLLGHLPEEQTSSALMYLMMSQTPPAVSVPRVASMIESINLAARKFSECIGMRQPATITSYEDNWTTRICSDGHTELIPKRIKIFEGGFKSNEDYTYVRGRGRGKYVCEDCGIRCKKPSMLKKHIRTHTDLRPYSCRHCAFAFKTKGNLTKHMKSKAHHKKCVEMGIVPVPTAIDDSQIDNEALAKQEQYELAINGGAGQFADDDDDGDEEFDEEDDDDDDDGVPIPLLEQQRLTYITPGQFDDAASETIEKTSRKVSTNSNGRSRKLSQLASSRASDTPTVSHASNESTADKCVTSLSSSTSLSVSANNAPTNETINIAAIQTRPTVKKISTTDEIRNDCRIEHERDNQTIDRPRCLSPSSPSSTNVAASAHAYDEVEAVRSLLILSGLATGTQPPPSTFASSLHKNIEKVRKTSTSIDEPHAKRKVSFKDDPIVMHRSPPSYHQHIVDLNRSQQQLQHQQQLLLMQQMGLPISPGQAPSHTIKPNGTGASSFPTSVIISNDKSRSLQQSSSMFASPSTSTPSNDNLPKLVQPKSNETINGKMQAAFIAEEIQRQAILLHQKQQNHNALITQAYLGVQAPGTLYDDARIHQRPNGNQFASNFLQNLTPASQLASLSANFGSAALSPISLEDNYTKIIEGSLNARAGPGKKEGLALQLIEKTTGFTKPSPNDPTSTRPNHHGKSSSPTNLFSSHSGPLPPPPSSPLVAPEFKTRRSRTTSLNTKESSSSLERFDDQPIDLSRKASTSAEPNAANLTGVQQCSPPSSASSSSPSRSSPLESKRSRISLDERVHYRPPSALSSLDMQTFPKFPLPSSTHHPHVNNGRELYNAIRSEEFYHKTPGVHSPNRLPGHLSASMLPSPSLSLAQQITPPSPFASEGKSVCKICAKVFSKPSQLQLHSNIHAMERLYRCETCAVSFRTKGHLQKHSRSVSHMNKMNMNNTFGRASDDNPRPFKCTDCKIAFRIHGHLAKHLRSKMHIMKLECLGKLPFGMYAEMERSNINLNLIDTTDGAKAHESLEALAKTLYDPRKMSWTPTEGTHNNDDDEDAIMEDGEDFSEEDDESNKPNHQPAGPSPPKIVVVGEEETDTPPFPQPTSSPPSSLISTRSNTCNICGRLFKAAKFLQVHLYQEHPDTVPS